MKSKNKCSKSGCSIKNTTPTNGKGDKVRPFAKKQYDKNYEHINWKRK